MLSHADQASKLRQIAERLRDTVAIAIKERVPTVKLEFIALIATELEALASAHGAEGDDGQQPYGYVIVYRNGSKTFHENKAHADATWKATVGESAGDGMHMIQLYAAPPPPKVPDSDDAKDAAQTAWLVENHNKSPAIRYLAFEWEGPVWREDHAQACRFARREDAEIAALGAELDDIRIVEHQWVTP